MGAGPSLLGVRCLFSRWAECQPPKKATQLFHHPWVINSCKPQGYRALPQSWEPFVGKCTWAFTPSSPWSPQSLTSSRKIWHAEERLCMTALLHLHRLCEHREPVIIQDLSAPIPERVSSHHSADTGTGLLLNVNRLLGVASPHFLCLPHFLCPHFHMSFTWPCYSVLTDLFESLVLEILCPPHTASSAVAEASPSFPFQLEMLDILFPPKPPFENTLVNAYIFSERFMAEYLQSIWFSPTTIHSNTYLKNGTYSKVCELLKRKLKAAAIRMQKMRSWIKPPYRKLRAIYHWVK